MYIYICANVYVYVYMYININIYIDMYIHVTYGNIGCVYICNTKRNYIYTIWIQQWPYLLRSISGYEVGVDCSTISVG